MTGFRNFLFAIFSGPRVPYPALPRPQPPVCLIGDIHGRFDLFQRLLDQVATREDTANARLVVLGDMIDRGPDAAAVLRLLHEMTEKTPDHVICLLGNHEQMMLDFLDDPARHGTRWMSFGGTETLQSFGVDPWAQGTGRDTPERMAALAGALRDAMPVGLESWLRGLPLIWREGRIAAIHAGADPARRLEDQDRDTLLWGHSAFMRHVSAGRSTRLWRDGIWVAHGHTIVETAHATDGRIAVDTGAWRTGRLSAAWIGQTGLSFLEVSDRQAPD